MTPDQITQLRQLLKKIILDINLYKIVEAQVLLDRTLALLPCETCGDTKLVDLVGTGFHKHDNGIGDPPKLYPCPDCQKKSIDK